MKKRNILLTFALSVELFGLTALCMPTPAKADGFVEKSVIGLGIVGVAAYARYTWYRSRNNELTQRIKDLGYAYAPSAGARATYVHNWQIQNPAQIDDCVKQVLNDLYSTHQFCAYEKNGTCRVLTQPCLAELVVALEHHSDYLDSKVQENKRLLFTHTPAVADDYVVVAYAKKGMDFFRQYAWNPNSAKAQELITALEGKKRYVETLIASVKEYRQALHESNNVYKSLTDIDVALQTARAGIESKKNEQIVANELHAQVTSAVNEGLDANRSAKVLNIAELLSDILRKLPAPVAPAEQQQESNSRFFGFGSASSATKTDVLGVCDKIEPVLFRLMKIVEKKSLTTPLRMEEKRDGDGDDNSNLG